MKKKAIEFNIKREIIEVKSVEQKFWERKEIGILD